MHVVTAAVPSDSNFRQKQHEKLEKYQGLREEMEKMWTVKARAMMGTLGAVPPRLGECPADPSNSIPL